MGRAKGLAQEEDRLVLKIPKGKQWKMVGKILHSVAVNLRENLMN